MRHASALSAAVPSCCAPAVANSRASPSAQQYTMDKITRQIAAELRVGETQVQAAVDLLDGGATVPFIARYRKEATDGLDDIQLRELRGAAGLPARTRGPARGGAQEHRASRAS